MKELERELETLQGQNDFMVSLLALAGVCMRVYCARVCGTPFSIAVCRCTIKTDPYTCNIDCSESVQGLI